MMFGSSYSPRLLSEAGGEDVWFSGWRKNLGLSVRRRGRQTETGRRNGKRGCQDHSAAETRTGEDTGKLEPSFHRLASETETDKARRPAAPGW